MPRFTGGPYDGRALTAEQINAVADVHAISTESGVQQFLLMPPPEEFSRMVSGQMSKTDTAGPLHSYKRVWTSGGAEYHHSSKAGKLSDAVAEANAPLSPEAAQRKARFAALADQFVQRIDGLDLSKVHDLLVIKEAVDRLGNPYDMEPISLCGTPTVRGLAKEKAQALAAALHRGTIIANIDAMVRNAMTGWLPVGDRPGMEVQIQGVRLLVEPVL